MQDPECNYEQQKINQVLLAEALESGEYGEQPQSDEYAQPLRDPQGRYTITGVATSLFTPAAWVRGENGWSVYQADEISHAREYGYTHRGEDPGEEQLDILLHHVGEGTSRGCPEQTACALDLHQDQERSEHTPHILVNHQNLTEPQPRAAGARRNQGGPEDRPPPGLAELRSRRQAPPGEPRPAR